MIAIIRLSVSEAQKGFVAPNAVSLAQALFAPEAWFRAIYCDDEPAGFVMLYDESLRPEPPERPKIGVWRFMVDQRYQGRGIGRRMLESLLEVADDGVVFLEVRTDNEPAIALYQSVGFTRVGLRKRYYRVSGADAYTMRRDPPSVAKREVP